MHNFYMNLRPSLTHMIFYKYARKIIQIMLINSNKIKLFFLKITIYNLYLGIVHKG
jgi:hypothetical protein